MTSAADSPAGPERLRLIVDPPRAGAENMAVDEAILLAVGDAAAQATLRLYRWGEPTVSLGYFQPWAELADQDQAVGAMPAVRRPTGGGAIVHDAELTYSLVLPAASAGPPGELYRWVHQAVAAAVTSMAPDADQPDWRLSPGGPKRDVPRLETSTRRGGPAGRDGPFFCFRRRGAFDLLAGGRKLAGSAQRRCRRAVLQHGSVILRRTFPGQGALAASDLVGRDVGFDEFAASLAGAIGAGGTSLQTGGLGPAERQALPALRDKHLSGQWLRRR